MKTTHFEKMLERMADRRDELDDGDELDDDEVRYARSVLKRLSEGDMEQPAGRRVAWTAAQRLLRAYLRDEPELDDDDDDDDD